MCSMEGKRAFCGTRSGKRSVCWAAKVFRASDREPDPCRHCSITVQDAFRGGMSRVTDLYGNPAALTWQAKDEGLKET